MKNYLYVLCLIFCLSGCNNDGKLADEMLSKAQSFYEMKEYASAKQMLDSLKITYPKEFDSLKKGLQLMRLVELSEQERNLAYCDSMIIVRQAQADSLKKGFLFEKDPKYDDIGKFIPKNQKIEQNLKRSYIRCGVNENGEMYLASVYYGSGPLKHTRLKVSSPNGDYTETANIPQDGGTNYSFVDGGMTTEVVTYQNGKDDGVIQFISNNIKEKLKAEYIGTRNYSIQISDADKRGVEQISELAIVLTDIQTLKKEVEKSKSRIAYLNSKTQSAPLEENHENLKE